MLSLSPHYFLSPDDPAYSGMSNDEYLEATFKECVDSRVNLYDRLLHRYFRETDTVVDYGCGPGFLARVLARNVKDVYACDISEGVLACARILNAAPNLKYVAATEKGLATFPDQSADVIVSFAMIQHISDEIFDRVLANMHRKLKPGGRLILHIQLIDDVWRTEDDWRSDNTVAGKIKFRYGLHCFGRTENRHVEMVGAKGFNNIEISKIDGDWLEAFPEIASQRILTADKPI
jgi:SAM-dependent methyltransferase